MPYFVGMDMAGMILPAERATVLRKPSSDFWEETILAMLLKFVGDGYGYADVSKNDTSPD